MTDYRRYLGCVRSGKYDSYQTSVILFVGGGKRVYLILLLITLMVSRSQSIGIIIIQILTDKAETMTVLLPKVVRLGPFRKV